MIIKIALEKRGVEHDLSMPGPDLYTPVSDQ
jgi:hypothetical protein